MPLIQILDNLRAKIQEWGNWQVIELGRDIIPTNIFTKFDKDRMKTDLEIGIPNFEFKGHNPGVPVGFGRLKNLVEILCPPTYSPSLIKKTDEGSP